MTRISIGPGDVAGYFSSLKHGFDCIGVESEHFLFSDTKYEYDQTTFFLKGISQKLNSLRDHDSKLIGFLSTFLSLKVRIIIFIYALFRFDVFVFFGSWSFFNFIDLPILKFFRKKIIVVFAGSDARPPYFNGRYLDDEDALADPRKAKAEAESMRRKIRKIERYADHIINQTAIDQFFTREYIRFAAIGMPVRIAEHSDPPLSTGRVKILHAPSRPISKGSPVFRKAVKELKEEGFAIDFVELIGVPNRAVLEAIASCDFVLDQVYSDLPLAMFAAEAAMLGKPAVVGGYYAASYVADNPDTKHPPSLFVSPDEIKDAIRRMIVDRDFRIALGEKARSFVSTHWNAATVAQRFLRIAEGQVPSSWLRQPQDGSYIFGWGLSKEAWRDQVEHYIRCNGWDATFLGDKPMLVRKIKNELDNTEIQGPLTKGASATRTAHRA